MILHSNGYLEEYRDAIKRGEIVAGVELITELDNLMADMQDPRYIYDTTDADMRIDFMQNCIKLTKSPAAFLSTIQIGVTLAGFLTSAAAADSFSVPLANWLWSTSY